ncbi:MULTISPECIES: RNA-binding protein [unclassified Pseudoalteromonas]|jgi:hypothetical protein|uniref:RNA-binding protein n=1 Tax=unclassified Pseudoalteromonas TaxID=194690 RepID=UPI00110BBEF5|nr:RNA-binding protein [Pseudoalteromonas sp. S558]TMN94378.1 RNA-binding protein [Pseudoalteromonas sp. S558]
MIKAILLSLCLTITFSCLAEDIIVYKCVIKGIPTFSQTPCAKNAKAITLKAPNITQTNSTKVSDNKTVGVSVDDYLKIQKIDRKIANLKLSIKQYEKEYNDKKQQINYMTQDKANRLGASSIADAIATKITSLKQSYEPVIQQAQQQIKFLTQQKLQLNQRP